MRLLYPASPLDPRQADDFFELERAAARAAGLATALWLEESKRISPVLSAGEVVVYRGWMLRAPEYARLQTLVEAAGARLLAPLEMYTCTHHLPEWYGLLEEFTPQTRFFENAAAAVAALAADSGPFFIKDWVKSLSSARGSMAAHPAQIAEIAAELSSYRGSLEGGLCVRDVEALDETTEQRFFVVDGEVMARSGAIPEIVRSAALRISSAFFTIDLIRRSDGVLRIIELGDGQVSDLKHWTLEEFTRVLKRLDQISSIASPRL